MVEIGWFRFDFGAYSCSGSIWWVEGGGSILVGVKHGDDSGSSQLILVEFRLIWFDLVDLVLIWLILVDFGLISVHIHVWCHFGG